MKALCWFGARDVRVEDVPDPKILNPRDAIVKVSSTAICGSDLHIYDGYIPSMEKGDVLGHEFMGEVVETGPEVKNLANGDRVVVPFPIACGRCWFCKRQMYSLCDASNPNAWMAEQTFGYATSGIFGYSHLMGGYAGGQAEYVRVPFADVGALKVDGGLEDEQVLFLSDILPTGWQAADTCDIQPGDTVAVWGAGPVGLMAMLSARIQGAERVVAVDRVPERLRLAADHVDAETVDYEEGPVLEQLKDLTGGRGPDHCIEAVGMEAHGTTVDALYDKGMQKIRMVTGRAHALRESILACRKGGTVAVAGVYGGLIDKIPFGAAFNKALTFHMGQTHVHRYMRPLLERIQRGEIDTRFLVTHRIPLREAPDGYATFAEKEDRCVKVVMRPAEA